MSSKRETIRFQFRIPKDGKPGQKIQVKIHTGETVTVNLPKKITPGKMLKVKAFANKKDNNDDDNDRSKSRNSKSRNSKEYRKKVMLRPYESWFKFRGYEHKFVPLGEKEVEPDPNQYIRPTGRKKALLIGINYYGTSAALKGCHNDVFMMHKFLQAHGFRNTPETMVCLLDDKRSDERFLPTKKNMLLAMQWLVHNAAPGDTLFFHFSGHGAQQIDMSGREQEGMNETVVPLDFRQEGVGMIPDDQMWDVLCAPLPSGCKLIALLDCCHSGTGLDLSYLYNEKKRHWDTMPNPNLCEGDVIMFSGCRDDQTSADAWTRDMNAPGGAMTTSFTRCFSEGLRISYFIEAVLKDIKRRGFSQRPQLSASQMFDPHKMGLRFDSGHLPNRNSHIGKVTVQKFEPVQPKLDNHPLGQFFANFVSAARGLVDFGGSVIRDIF